MKKIKLSLLIISTLILFACATTMQTMQSKYPEPELDPKKFYANYPKYRIDNKVNKIGILGKGLGQSEISSALTQIIMKFTNIKVVEPGNLQSVLGGKIIEYGTGLTTTESQALAQMLQIDHVILFDDKISPYRDYIYGGRAYNQIYLKIINTLNGEIIFQTSSNVGMIYKDPRPYGYSSIEELSTSSMNQIRDVNLNNLAFQLVYIFGYAKTGLIFTNDLNQVLVQAVMANSPADKAGIKEGDRIIGINGIKINNGSDYDNYFGKNIPKQGDVLKFTIERGGILRIVEVKLPVIPFSPEEPKEEPEREKTIKATPI